MLKSNGSTWRDRITKTMTLIAAGQLQMFSTSMKTWLPTRKGVLEPLDKFIEAEEPGYLDGFYKSLIDLMTWRGSIYAMPQEVSPTLSTTTKRCWTSMASSHPPTSGLLTSGMPKLSKSPTPARRTRYMARTCFPGLIYLMHLSRKGIEIYDEGGETLWIAA